eukprot:jgi/Undpi1/4293/HiC_scaffold_17.g07659.m1
MAIPYVNQVDSSLALRTKILSLYSLDTNSDAVISETYHRRCKFVDPLVSTSGHREVKAQFRSLRVFLRQSKAELVSSHYDVASRSLTMDMTMVFKPKLWPFSSFRLSPSLHEPQTMVLGLTGWSWILLFAHALWFGLLGHALFEFWKIRAKMRVNARSPMLTLVSGVASISMQFCILLQEVLAQEGKVLPCVIILYMNAVAVAFYALPYLLRGMRIVIVSDRVYRQKYVMFLSQRNSIIILMVCFVGVMGVCGMLHKVSPQVYGSNPTEMCFFLGDWWFFGPTSFGFAAICYKLFLELSRVQDRINMSKEIVSASGVWFCTAIPHFSLIVLNAFKVIEAPRQTNFVLGICTFLTDVSSFFIEPRRHKGCWVCWKKKKPVVVIDDANTSAWRERWNSSKVLMECPILDEAFAKHVQDYLCSESYDFLKAVDRYIRRAEEGTDREIYVAFREIVDLYIVVGSELEVNIEAAMRNKVLQLGEWSTFQAAGIEQKRDIFNPPEVEVRKMLDENLLKSFLISKVFLNACKRVQEEEDAEASMTIEGKLDMPTNYESEGQLTMAQAVMNMERSKVSILRRFSTLPAFNLSSIKESG